MNLSISRIFKCDAKTLFESIAGGALFKFTGAENDSFRLDFKEGGTFHIDWKDSGHCDGAFKEIIPYSKIVFSWNDYSQEKDSFFKSVVTISIKEINGNSTLTLVHEGFEKIADIESYDYGWDDALADLHKSLRRVFAKIENNPSGLDLYFKLKKRIKSPRAQVFKSVFDNHELSKYFGGVKASGPLSEGKMVEWKFEGHSPMTLDVQKVIKEEMIKFQMGKSHVCFSFQDKVNESTEVVIEATGWDANQGDLDESYSECEGWMDFLGLLKFHNEKH